MSETKPKHIVIDARIRRSSTGRYTDRLVEHLQKIDHENRYTILVEPDDNWQTTNENFVTIPCRYKQFSFNPFEQIGFAWQLYRLKADLVHFTMTQQPIMFFGNIVTTTHDLTMLRFVRPKGTLLPIYWLKMLGYRFLFWQAHKKSQIVIVPTNFVQEDLAKYHPFTQDKSVVTYEASEPPLKTKAEAPEGAPKEFLLYVGTSFPHKNINRLVDAMVKLHSKYPDMQLLLAGKKEYYYDLLDQYIAETGSEAYVKPLGFVSDAELKWLYQNAKAYVFPSLSEGFGLPGLEAMAHGCPVISSNATCLPEVYGDAAHYFDPLDVDDMTQKISEVIDSKSLREELVKKGTDQLVHYSWEKMASETHSIYASTLHP